MTMGARRGRDGSNGAIIDDAHGDVGHFFTASTAGQRTPSVTLLPDSTVGFDAHDTMKDIVGEEQHVTDGDVAACETLAEHALTRD
jgi:hypothetical protein